MACDPCKPLSVFPLNPTYTTHKPVKELYWLLFFLIADLIGPLQSCLIPVMKRMMIPDLQTNNNQFLNRKRSVATFLLDTLDQEANMLFLILRLPVHQSPFQCCEWY